MDEKNLQDQREERTPEEQAIENASLFERPVPVSYTHLDVYKGQVLERLLVNVVFQTVHCRLERLSLRRHLGLLVGIARRYKILRLFYGFLKGGKAFICVEPAVVADFFGFGYK